MPAATVGGCGEFVLPLLTRFHKYKVWVKLNFVIHVIREDRDGGLDEFDRSSNHYPFWVLGFSFI